MPFDIVMPKMGESIAEATILKWHRKAGETIGKDETLYEISTDKVDAEIPSPVAGTVLEILVDVNQTVPVGTVVARVGEAGEAGEAPVPENRQQGKTEDGSGKPAAPQAPLPPPAPVPEPASAEPEELPATPSAPAPPPVPAPAAPAGGESEEERLRTRSSPLVRRMAEAHGIDLRQVKGTGQLGRVTKEDLEDHLARRPAAPEAIPAQPAPPAQAPSAPPAQPPTATPLPPLGTRVEPMSRMRKLISEHMVHSKHTSPHVYTVFEIDMAHLAALRARHKARFQAETGAKLSYLPFVLMAACKALRAHPILNASLQGDDIHYHGSVDMGVAVALDWGLIVPVIRGAEQLNLAGLARAAADLAERARSRQLKPEEATGGTFTVTNPGVFGDAFGLPIINQPQVAILGMGAIRKRPVVVTDAAGQDALAIHETMFSSLGFDHRLVDGATADQFMSVFRQELEQGNFGLE